MLKRLRGLFICEASFWSFCKRWENTSNKTPKIDKNSKRNNLSDIIKHCHLCQVINTNLRRYMYKWRNVVNCRKLLGKKYFNLDIDLIKYYFFFWQYYLLHGCLIQTRIFMEKFVYLQLQFRLILIFWSILISNQKRLLGPKIRRQLYCFLVVLVKYQKNLVWICTE